MSAEHTSSLWGEFVEHITVYGRTKEALERHVAVIAAAPELLAVLLRARDAIEALDGTSIDNEKLVDDYRAAITKATGKKS